MHVGKNHYGTLRNKITHIFWSNAQRPDNKIVGKEKGGADLRLCLYYGLRVVYVEFFRITNYWLI